MGVTGECDPGHDSCQFGPYGADESMCLRCTGSSCPRRRNVKHGYSADCYAEAQQLPRIIWHVRGWPHLFVKLNVTRPPRSLD